MKKKFPKYAIEMALKTKVVNEIITISDSCIYEGERFFKIPPIQSINDYNRLVFELIPKVVNSSHYLIIQWDGFPINPHLWTSDFLGYDYIGAPWNNNDTVPVVGNGGFSLRSNILNKVITNNINEFWDFSIPEDVYICRKNRKLLESLGVNFPDISIANKFSIESGPFGNHFGFHGVFNLPIVIDENFLCENISEIFKRTSSEMIYVELINSIVKNKKFELLKLTIENLLKNQSKYPVVINYLQYINLIK